MLATWCCLCTGHCDSSEVVTRSGAITSRYRAEVCSTVQECFCCVVVDVCMCYVVVYEINPPTQLPVVSISIVVSSYAKHQKNLFRWVSLLFDSCKFIPFACLCSTMHSLVSGAAQTTVWRAFQHVPVSRGKWSCSAPAASMLEFGWQGVTTHPRRLGGTTREMVKHMQIIQSIPRTKIEPYQCMNVDFPGFSVKYSRMNDIPVAVVVCSVLCRVFVSLNLFDTTTAHLWSRWFDLQDSNCRP